VEPSLEIINQALGYVGQESVSDINENKFSRLAGVFWLSSVRQVLRAHPWNFAITRVMLAPMADAPPSGYSAQFALPADYLRLMEVSEREYRLERKRILCDSVSIAVKYVAMVTDITLFDSLAEGALIRLLAHKLAYPITKSTTQQDAQWSAYTQELAMARIIDAQEDPAEEMEESSLITSRG
jgi:hypothetical protein